MQRNKERTTQQEERGNQDHTHRHTNTRQDTSGNKKDRADHHKGEKPQTQEVNAQETAEEKQLPKHNKTGSRNNKDKGRRSEEDKNKETLGKPRKHKHEKNEQRDQNKNTQSLSVITRFPL